MTPEWFSRLESKVDRLDERLDDVDKTLIRQEGNLSEHMRRTDLAESAVAALKAELKPVATHVAVVGGLAKVVGFLAVCVGIVEGVLHLVRG